MVTNAAGTRPVERRRPRLSVTVSPENHRRLLLLRDRLPGTSTSWFIDQMLSAALPMMEDLSVALADAWEEGRFDEARARDALAKWAGAQMLDFMSGMSDMESEEEVSS